MARTPGSGWGAGPLLWQKCPECGKKKVLFRFGDHHVPSSFKCYFCKKEVDGTGLVRRTHS